MVTLTRVQRLAVLVLVASTTLTAAQTTQQNDAWIKRSDQVLGDAAANEEAKALAAQAARIAEEARSNPEMQAIAGQSHVVLNQSVAAQIGQSEVTPEDIAKREIRTRIFISMSMPDAVLDAAIYAARAPSDSMVVLRG